MQRMRLSNNLKTRRDRTMKPGKSHTSLLYLLAFLMCVIVPGTLPAQSASGKGLKTCTTNPNYFCDSNGNVVYLTGSHYWMVFLDSGKSYPPPVFDYVGYRIDPASLGA